MRKLFIGILAVAVVFGMSLGVMAGNIADIQQEDGADAFAEQIGSLNKLYLDQDTGGGAYNATADIVQYGDENLVYLNQNVWSAHNTATADIHQKGNYNFAGVESDNINQTNTATLDIRQEGDSNESYVSQTTNYSHDIAYLEQEGNENLVKLKQTDGQAYIHAYIHQIGDSNTLRLEQNDAEFPEQPEQNDSEVFFTQLGDENKFVGFNGEEKTDWAYQNTSEFTGQQTGDRNVIGLHQGGNDSADINQIGNDNEALLWQSEGADHLADITQIGDNNTAEVIQQND